MKTIKKFKTLIDIANRNVNIKYTFINILKLTFYI